MLIIQIHCRRRHQQEISIFAIEGAVFPRPPGSIKHGCEQRVDICILSWNSKEERADLEFQVENMRMTEQFEERGFGLYTSRSRENMVGDDAFTVVYIIYI